MRTIAARVAGAPFNDAEGWIDVVDPSTADVVARVERLGASDVARALASAVSGARVWSARSIWERADILRAAASGLRARRSIIIDDLVVECGKPVREARGEVDKAIATFEYYAGLAGQLDGRSFEGRTVGVRNETRLEPVGIVGLITPWNVPAAGPARKLAPALLAGNAILFKPASATPITAWHLVDSLIEAGVDAAALQLIFGGGGDVGWALATDPAVDALSFTGSTDVGCRIQSALGGRLSRLQLELGGKNAAIVLADADLDRAVDLIIIGAFTTAGQQCTATSRVIADHRIARTLTTKLIDRIDALRVGDPRDELTDVGPLIDEGRVEATLGFIKRAVAEGATLARGGKRLDRPGCFVAPALLTGVSAKAEVATTEVFGPVLSVLTVRSVHEAIAVLNGTEYGLSAAVHTNDLRAARRIVSEADAGIVAVNGSTAGIELAVPFGGFKRSGTESKEHGGEALRFYSRLKSVTWS